MVLFLKPQKTPVYLTDPFYQRVSVFLIFYVLVGSFYTEDVNSISDVLSLQVIFTLNEEVPGNVHSLWNYNVLTAGGI